MVKNLPAMQGVQVQSLSEEDSSRGGNGNPLVFLPGKSHGQRSLVGYSPQCWKRVGHDWTTQQQLLNSSYSLLPLIFPTWTPDAYKALILLMSLITWSEVLVIQVCPTLCDPVDCSPPGSSVPGTLQARILEWDAISFSRGSSSTFALNALKP